MTGLLSMKYILIAGAKSDIARAIAVKYAENGYHLLLAARNHNSLSDFAADLRIRFNIEVKLYEFDVVNFNRHQQFFNQLQPSPFGVIVCVGYLGDEIAAREDFNEVLKITHSNYTGIVSLLNIAANHYQQQQSGFIIAISSVAGDRGRQSNYFYGSAKAALSSYLSGLRNRLHRSGVHVITVKPGFVATRMTAGMDLPGALTASPEQVAGQIFNAQQKGKQVIYSLAIWRWIMFIIRHIPEFIFKRLSL